MQTEQIPELNQFITQYQRNLKNTQLCQALQVRLNQKHKSKVAENGNREVHYANRSKLLNNIIQTYSPQLFEQPIADSEFEKVNGEANQENKNIKTLPNEEESEPQEKPTESKNTKNEKVPIRTTRPIQEENHN